MTFLEAALNILGREKRPLHFKDLTERAMTKKLLTFVGRTPEVTMQTQLTAAVKKAPGNPFVRVKPGVFGLLRYPEMPPEEPEAAPEKSAGADKATKSEARTDAREPAGDAAGRGRRRRRRGGRGRGREDAAPVEGAEAATAEGDLADQDQDNDEPAERGMSAAARAAALAETGVLEGDDGGDEDAATEAGGEELMSQGDEAREDAPASATEDLEGEPLAARGDGGDDDGDEGDADGDDLEEGVGAEGASAGGDAAKNGDELGPGRRRRRRRRRRGGGEGLAEGAPRSAEGGGEPSLAGSGDAGVAASALSGDEGRPSDGASDGEGQGPRRIMTPVDAAIEILRGQAPGVGVHVRRIAEAAARRRLVHGEQNEAWRVMRAALATEPRERLRAGLRPRVRAAGAGLFALARRSPDAELERAELVFGEARRALRERTVAALERRIADLSAPAFEALARVLLQREGFGPATFVKRIESTVYIEALRGRGSRPSKVMIALRSGGSTAGRRAVGELRAGIVRRGQEEGLLMLAGRLSDDAIEEWKKPGQSDPASATTHVPPVEIADGQAMAETCLRHGLGVINATVSVDFVDADFFAELAEG